VVEAVIFETATATAAAAKAATGSTDNEQGHVQIPVTAIVLIEPSRPSVADRRFPSAVAES